MAYRKITPDFWSDPKVTDDFTPEDRYFYLYLLTNPHTNICGCYELSAKAAARETGYNEDSVKHLLYRMATVHKVIGYNPITKECLLINWHRHNWSSSPTLIKSVMDNATKIKTDAYRDYVLALVNGKEDFSIPYGYGIEKDNTVSVSVTVTDTVSNTDNKNKEKIEEIVSYLNSKAGTNYKTYSKQTAAHINARLAEGYTVDDFITVIDKKCDAWLNDEKMAKYIRPETLFGSKFEAYLNERKAVRSGDRFLAELEEIYRSEKYGE